MYHVSSAFSPFLNMPIENDSIIHSSLSNVLVEVFLKTQTHDYYMEVLISYFLKKLERS